LKRDPKNRDIRDFVSEMKPGGRYRILLHPQYYSTNCRQSKRYAGTSWYDQLITQSRAGNFDSWSDVAVNTASIIGRWSIYKIYLISFVNSFHALQHEAKSRLNSFIRKYIR
jgi:hypothetical protein